MRRKDRKDPWLRYQDYIRNAQTGGLSGYERALKKATTHPSLLALEDQARLLQAAYGKKR